LDSRNKAKEGNTEKLKIKSLLEIAEEIFKNARGTTVSERKAINDFIKTKLKVVLSELSKKM